MADRFVTIRTLHDPLEAETLKALLEGEGIPTTIQGSHHSALYGGLLASALHVPLQVPESQAERARAILDALHDFEPVEPLDVPPRTVVDPGAGPYRSSAAIPDPPTPRKMSVAIAAALVMPCVIVLFGAGHFYVRSRLRGVALLMTGWTALLLFVMRDMHMALAVLPLVVALDALGAVLVIRSDQGG